MEKVRTKIPVTFLGSSSIHLPLIPWNVITKDFRSSMRPKLSLQITLERSYSNSIAIIQNIGKMKIPFLPTVVFHPLFELLKAYLFLDPCHILENGGVRQSPIEPESQYLPSSLRPFTRVLTNLLLSSVEPSVN